MLKVCEVIDETSFAFVTFDEDERFLFKEWCKEAKKALKKKEIILFLSKFKTPAIFKCKDVNYEIALHDMVMHLIKTAEITKVSRVNTKFLFHPLTDAIKDIYIPAQESENSKKWAYKLLMDLANLKGLGMTSQAYKKVNNLTTAKIQEDGNISIRDYMTKLELSAIEEAEKHIHGLIVYAEITDYHKLKAKILN
jgi:hypothetical protein